MPRDQPAACHPRPRGAKPSSAAVGGWRRPSLRGPTGGAAAGGLLDYRTGPDVREGEAMRAIDADAHIDENEQTWEYLDEADQRFKPISFELPGGRGGRPGGRPRHRLWLIDGNARLRRFRSDQATGTTRRPASYSTWTPACGTWTSWGSTCRCSTRRLPARRHRPARRRVRCARLTTAGWPTGGTCGRPPALGGPGAAPQYGEAVARSCAGRRITARAAS